MMMMTSPSKIIPTIQPSTPQSQFRT